MSSTCANVWHVWIHFLTVLLTLQWLSWVAYGAACFFFFFLISFSLLQSCGSSEVGRRVNAAFVLFGWDENKQTEKKHTVLRVAKTSAYSAAQAKTLQLASGTTKTDFTAGKSNSASKSPEHRVGNVLAAIFFLNFTFFLFFKVNYFQPKIRFILFSCVLFFPNRAVGGGMTRATASTLADCLRTRPGHPD